MQFLIETKNPHYEGRVYGLPFANGRAILSRHTLDSTLGRSVEEVAERLRRLNGYTVKELEGDDVVAVAEDEDADGDKG